MIASAGEPRGKPECGPGDEPGCGSMGEIVYFSSKSENTRRFVDKLGLPARRIPISSEATLAADRPFVLIVPSYGGGGQAGAVPKQVIRFLNEAENRRHIRGVIAAGNTNFGAAYGIAGDIISHKCQVPFLYRFELLGTQEDVANVRHGLERFWTRQALS
jgi:protein involved in ribonucleotide reduction